MADQHAARMNAGGCGQLQAGDMPSNGFVLGASVESAPDGDNDTDDIGSYDPIPEHYGQLGAGFISERSDTNWS